MDSTAKINRAVRAGLKQCSGSMPYSELREFLKELKATGKYSPDELKAIEDAITRTLHGQK